MPPWKKAQRVFVTADTHFGDDVAFGKFARPFPNVEAMDRALVAAINERVRPKDILLHLGDFSGELEWTKSRRTWLRGLRDRIECRTIVLVRGNVDPLDEHWFDGMFESVHDLITWKTRVGETAERPMRVVASHYPMRQWQGWLNGALHLYGHVHGTLPEDGRSTDVGVDCWSYAPVDLSSLLRMLAARPFERPTTWPRQQPMRSAMT
ncbi:MAG: metallophosphoesterase [Phycisphaerales bacterium]